VAKAAGRHRAPRPTLTDRVGAAVPGVGTALGAGAVGATALGMIATNAGASAAPQRDRSEQVAPQSRLFAAPSGVELAALRACEASGRYSTNTGNGFYGAYQFDAGTWHGLGLSGLPSQASPSLQDSAASALEQARGWQPWPACSARLGLVPRRAHAVAAPLVLDAFGAATGPAATLVLDSSPRAAGVPAFPGTVLSTAQQQTYRSDVQLWQQRMSERGWPIESDGHFGPQSASVAASFAHEKALPVTLSGEVNAAVWRAAWALPVTR
jgi:hypothetical protein